jgi:hypothetical protein
MMSNGITLDSWANIDGQCQIECDIVGDQAQFRLGGRGSGLDLVCTEQGPANFLEQATIALEQMRTE